MERPEPRFEVLRPLGEGATARVELVRLLEPFDGLPVGAELALKTLSAAPADEGSARAAFAAEVDAAATVRAPSLVRVLHAGERDGRPYLLLQYVPGRTLREVLDQEGPLPEPRLRTVGTDLARALAALHAHGLVHGDVKPENGRLDEEGRAVLLDLGFARKARERQEARPGAGGGSLAYLSPERVRGEATGPAADMFALGVMLYELATGLHPFGTRRSRARQLGRASTSGAIARRSIEVAGADELLAAIADARVIPPSRFAPSLSPFLDRCLTELLARAPGERPSAEGLATRLAQGERGDWWSAHLERVGREGERRPAEASAWPLVGRARELTVLSDVFAALQQGEPRAAVVWLVGPEGSGKWRLLTSFAEGLRKEAAPPLVLDARWNEADEGRPAGAALMWLNRWLGLPAGRAPRPRDAERLTELIGSAPALALLAALDPKKSGSIDRSIPGDLARCLGKLAEDRPVLLFLDDLHHAGGVTLAALSTLLEHLRGARVMFGLALREDVPAAEPEQLKRSRERLERGALDDGPHFRRLEVGAIERAALATLVAKLFHDSAPRERLVEVLWDKSRGNPGFLTEILRELEARGGVQPAGEDDPRWMLTVGPDQLPTPRSLDKLIQERLAALEPEERLWLERLSVVGGRLLPGFLVKAFPPTRRVEIDDVLARLARKGWLVPAADRYRFERPALREALYRALSAPRRRRLHAAAARGLDPSLEDLEEAYQRAFHLQAAGEHGELIDTVHAILPRLRRRASAQRLSTLARWGLEALEQPGALEGRESLRLELLEEGADAADRLGRRGDQRVLLDHMANIELDPEEHPKEAARLYLLHARYAAGTGQFGLARGWLKTANQIAQASGDSWLVSQTLRRLGQVQAQIGEFEDARKLARRALEAADGANQEALAHLALAHVDVLEDELEDALAGVEAALSALRKTREPRAGVLAYAELLRGRVWRSAGLSDKALGATQRAIVLARRAGERRLEAEARARRGRLLLDLGGVDEARAELKGAQLLADEIEDRRGQVLSTLWLGLLEFEEGEAHAQTSVQLSLERASEMAFYRAEAFALTLLARLHLERGEHEAAERASEHAVDLIERHGAELTDRLFITGTRVLLLREAGRKQEAKRARTEIDRRARAGQRRIRAPELREPQKDYVERLLAAVLSVKGPAFPRRGS